MATVRLAKTTTSNKKALPAKKSPRSRSAGVSSPKSAVPTTEVLHALEQQAASLSSGLWENDPHSLPMTPVRRRAIDRMVFAHFMSQGLTPDTAYAKDPVKRRAFAKWLADPANQPAKDAVAPLIPNPRLAKEKWQMAAAKARATGKMANTLAKALAQRHAKRWRFIDFRGMGGQESRGIVDILAVRKDSKTEYMGLKTYDLFEIALIQVKGGTAPMPTLEDLGRMRTVAERYGATQIVLFQWTKGVSSGFYELATDNRWLEKSAKQLFG